MGKEVFNTQRVQMPANAVIPTTTFVWRLFEAKQSLANTLSELHTNADKQFLMRELSVVEDFIDDLTKSTLCGEEKKSKESRILEP